MAVFTNRKYPELDIYEVGAPISADYQCPIQIDLEYLRIFVKPVFVSKVFRNFNFDIFCFMYTLAHLMHYFALLSSGTA